MERLGVDALAFHDREGLRVLDSSLAEELLSYGTLGNPGSGIVDLACVEDFLMQVSRLIEKHVEIQEMDLNPVLVASSDIEVCDARIRIG